MGWFDRDGPVTLFFEKIPVLGHATALVHVIAGNPEHAKRATATSTNSLITTACAVGGAAVGVIGGGRSYFFPFCDGVF
jgi:hypothetical protein